MTDEALPWTRAGGRGGGKEGQLHHTLVLKALAHLSSLRVSDTGDTRGRENAGNGEKPDIIVNTKSIFQLPSVIFSTIVLVDLFLGTSYV